MSRNVLCSFGTPRTSGLLTDLASRSRRLRVSLAEKLPPRGLAVAHLNRQATLFGYQHSQPSFRYRMLSLVGALEAAGWTVHLETYPAGRYGLRTWERRALLTRSSVVVLHQIKLSDVEARLFAAFAPRVIFDFDDAIYVRKPRRLGEPAGDSWWRRRKFAATCRAVDVVVAGNDVLARAAAPYAQRLVILPTALDTSVYRATTATQDDPPTIAWVGSPENLVYLEILHPRLRACRRAIPRCASRSSARSFRIGLTCTSIRCCGARRTRLLRLQAPTLGSCH
jgi:hypothetical protein